MSILAITSSLQAAPPVCCDNVQTYQGPVHAINWQMTLVRLQQMLRFLARDNVPVRFLAGEKERERAGSKPGNLPNEEQSS
jgi:hypothetical protein